MDYCSTRQAARKLGLPSTTLAQYIAAKKVPTPKPTKVGRIRILAWTAADIERVHKLLPTIKNGRKTRYRKKHSAVSKQQSVKPKETKHTQAKKKSK